MIDGLGANYTGVVFNEFSKGSYASVDDFIAALQEQLEAAYAQ